MKRALKILPCVLMAMAVTFILMPTANAKAEVIYKKLWKGFVYTRTTAKDGEVNIINYKGKAKKLTIPSKIKKWDVGRVSSLGKSKTLRTVHISEGVEIGGALASCPNLKKITVSKKHKKYKVKNNLLLSKNGKTLYACPGGVSSKKIPDSVRKIAAHAFEGSPIQKIVFGKNVREIELYAFSKCKNLSSITFNNKLKIIGSQDFEYCNSLTSVVLPDSLTEMHYYIFYQCKNLKTAVIGKNVRKIWGAPFHGCKKLESVYVYSPKCKTDENLVKYASEKVTVYGISGSWVEQNVKEYGIKFQPL